MQRRGGWRSLGAAVWVGGLAALGGCSRLDAGRSCPTGAGLAAVPLRGDSLADGELALTFDGGPTEATEAIGDLLFANGVSAAFFVGGKAAAATPAALVALKRRGHLVANHGYTETSLAQSSEAVLEVRKTDELITPAVSGNAFLLRAPDGGFDLATARRLNAAGLGKYVGPVQWDIGDSADEFVDDRSCWAQGLAPVTCAQGYLTAIRAKKRGIVRLHAERAETAELLRTLLPKLKDELFALLRIDAVPAIRTALAARGAEPGTVDGPAGCDEY